MSGLIFLSSGFGIIAADVYNPLANLSETGADWGIWIDNGLVNPGEAVRMTFDLLAKNSVEIGGSDLVPATPADVFWAVGRHIHSLAALAMEIDMMGRDYFVNYLSTFFEKTPLTFGWNEYCNHANEPVHHTAYLFTYAGKPWLTQKWARTIMDHAYGDGVNGLCGNEDVGQMSAWYILSAIGFHPVSPVDGVYIIGSPLFNEVTIKLDSLYYFGKTFTIRTHNNSVENMYVQSATLNGKPLNRAWLHHAEVAAGGISELEMGPKPNKSWGPTQDELPPRNFPPMSKR